MRIYIKRIKVIEMSKAEMEAFKRTIDKAAEGQTVNYAEEQMSDGSFLGVSLQSWEQAEKERQQREDYESRERERQRVKLERNWPAR